MARSVPSDVTNTVVQMTPVTVTLKRRWMPLLKHAALSNPVQPGLGQYEYWQVGFQTSCRQECEVAGANLEVVVILQRCNFPT